MQKKNRTSFRSSSRALALEPRLLFDGAGAVAAVDYFDTVGEHQAETQPQAAQPAADARPSEVAEKPAASLPLLDLAGDAANAASGYQLLLGDAASLAQQKLVEWVGSDAFRAQAAEIFSADAGSAEWEAQLDALRNDVLNGSYSIRVETRSNAELQGLYAAYSATGSTGQPTIYLNAGYLAGANAEQVQQLLIEEIGHDIDQRLNGGLDSEGDEGHAFAALLTTGNADLAANQIRGDHHTLAIDGVPLAVESASPYNIAQVHFVPMPEDQIWSGIQNIYSSSSDNKIESIIAITATSNDTYVVYDHWEDGYEADIKNPQSATTRIWYYNNGVWTDVKTGVTLTDGQTVNGVTAQGQSLILRNQVNKNSLATVDFDGRDKIGSTKAISVTRAGWDTKIGTIVGGAVNVIDVGNAGKEFVIPVGSDTTEAPKISGNSIFQKNSLYIMAYEDNTTVTVDLGGGKSITRTLQQGQSLYIKGLVTGGTFKAGTGLNDAEAVINDGTTVTANKAIGVNMLSGSNTSQNRWYSIAPTESWGNSYYAPVATVGGATSHIYLYNNNSDAITVSYETRGAGGTVTTNTVTIAANSARVVAMPASAAHFWTADGKNFYAVATVDPTTSRDWSYSLVAERTLTDRFVVAWGPGNGNTADSNGVISGKNGSPVWVTAVDDTWLYIDSATTELKDAQGNTVAKDASLSTGSVSVYKIDRLQSYRLRDTSDNNQTGLVVYTVDGTLITAAWGEDATVADTGSPYLDMGTTISPYPDYVLEKKAAEIVNHGRENGVIEAGDEVRYTITLTNRAVIELLNIKITDTIEPAGSAEYVPNSLTLTSFDENGKKVWEIVSGGSGGTKTYYLADGVTVDTSKGSNGVETFTDFDGNALALVAGYTITDAIDRNGKTGLQIGGYIQFTYKVTINESIDKTLADANFIVSNSVKLQADGVEKDKINKIDLSGTITDGVVTFISGEDGTEVTSFEPGNDIWIRVTDNDQNKNATTAQTLTVVLTNSTTGEKETVTLTETDVNTGVFEGRVSTTRGTGSAADDPDDRQFKLKRGDAIKVEYTDPNTGNPSGDANNGVDNPTNWGINSPNYQLGENNNIKIATVEDSGISVNDILVNEASPYGVFTVQGAKGQPVKLELTGAGTATLGTDYQTSLEYYDVTSGTWEAYTPGSYVTIENTDGTLLVRNPIVNDDVYEGAETYELKVTPKKLDGTDGSSTTGTATIFDDGTGTIWKDPPGPNPIDPTGEDPNAPKDHDRFPQVDNPVVNEGAGYVVFTVTTQKGDTITKLTLADGTATSSGGGDGETDYTQGSFEYWNGSTWVSYTNDTATTIVVPDNGAGTYGELQVRVAITDDTLYEFSENFTLTIETITAGRAVGTATIKDDGTGTIWVKDPDNPGDLAGPTDPLKPLTPPSGDFLLDDDRDTGIKIEVDNPVVNEASGFVVFTVKNTDDSNPVDVALSLADGSAEASSTPPAYGESDKDYSPNDFEYWNGAEWEAYTSGSVTIDAGDELQVRVKIHNDTVYEGAETFNLVVTPGGGGGTAVTGTATILDDGTGTIWVPGTPDTPGTPKDPSDPNQPGDPTDELIPFDPTDNVPNLPFNDDRTPFVTSPTVNEGSPYVVFEVTTVKGEVLSKLLFTDGSAKGGTTSPTSPTDGSVDYGNNALQYSTDGGTTWLDYTSGDVKVPTGTLLVRTTIVNDDNYEVSENFNLTVTVKSDAKTATGVATILDNGTGTVWEPTDPGDPLSPLNSPKNPTTDPLHPFDDDRPVSVSSPMVNEGSPWIVFEVGGIAGTSITSLVLANGTATGGTATDGTEGHIDYKNDSLQYFDGSQWQNWTEGVTKPNIPAGGTLLVRVAIFNDTLYEKSETFTLTAKTQGGKQSTGIGTIKDDGTGTIWIPENPGSPGQPNNPGDPADPGTVNDTLIPKVPTGPAVPNLSFDDDRSIQITNGGKLSGGNVNEGSVKEDANHVFFKVSDVETGELVNLGLANGDSHSATTGGFVMDYSTDGGATWTRYTWNGSTGSRPVAPANGEILVRVDISSEDDEVYTEGNETFKLTAHYASNASKSATGVGTIADKSAGPLIVVDDRNGPADGDITVHEGGLLGKDPAKPGKATGTVTITSDELIGTVDIGDNDKFTITELLTFSPDNPSKPVDTNKGYIRVTGFTDNGDGTYTLAYEYELHTPQGHDPGTGEQQVTDQIDITVTDTDGGNNTGSVIVRILDDEPLARNDENNLLQVTPSVSGNVMDNDYRGGDSSTVTGVAAGSGTADVAGNVNARTKTEYGWITVQLDGSYVYELDRADPRVATLTDGFKLQDHVTYTITDEDGDTSTAVLTITINPEAPGAVVAPPPTDSVPPSPLDGPAGSQTPISILNGPVITDPSVYFANERHDNVQRMPLPFHPIVYVNREVASSQAQRDQDDPRGFSDPSAAVPGERPPVSLGAGLGQDPNLFVSHAIRDSQSVASFLRSTVEGRYSRLGLGSDGYLASPGLFSQPATEISELLKEQRKKLKKAAGEASAAVAENGQGDAPATQPQIARAAGQPDRAAARASGGVAAPSFNEQLRSGAARLPMAARKV